MIYMWQEFEAIRNATSDHQRTKLGCTGIERIEGENSREGVTKVPKCLNRGRVGAASIAKLAVVGGLLRAISAVHIPSR
jgi:hypothetical protein